MKISYNFISLVAIGNFNPAILSPDFLNDKCGLNLGEPSPEAQPPIPVFRHWEFQNLHFNLTLDRFEIKEVGVEDISKTDVLGIFKVYYDKLPYTPLKAVGVNINCDIHPETTAEFGAIGERIKDPSVYLQFLNADQISVTERSIFTKGEVTWVASDYRIENVRGLTRLINAMKRDKLINLNYNYEASNQTEMKSHLDSFFDVYPMFCEEFLGFVKNLEE